MRREDFFPINYAAARDRFRAAAKSAQAAQMRLALDNFGPERTPLTIDIAWWGDRNPRRVLLHTSGLHGVEAFAGSAVQVAALNEFAAPPAECAMVLVHVLNPFGMAWLRRTNENNVDLNRNFFADSARQNLDFTLYDELDALLNPPGPPVNDFFRWRIMVRAARHGPRRLGQAIAQGQYRYPQGLFFGGDHLEPGPAQYLDWLRANLGQTDYLFALDLHTGLGPRGKTLLMPEPGTGATPVSELDRALGHPLSALATDPSRPYRVSGGMGTALPRTLPKTRIDFVLQEIGTYGPVTILSALRDENRWHHYGTGGLEHSSKRALLEALCPRSPLWRRQAVEQGVGMLRAAASWTFSTAQ